ncbi:MAG TPA: HIT family protein [Steroidobacteraceae bacterium]|jgi:diadenosine tetraphosphate (Ap4A) HIT family hydrolase|nr:HIT family protein [Steroidobacteraceae bacterium]
MTGAAVCPFCNGQEAVLEASLAYARFDKYPAARGHLLILPRRHVADWFETTADEQLDLWALAKAARELLLREYAPDGFNLGINVGEAAGQTVFHAHLHVIPRYRGDVEDPRGGVRAVITGKQYY